MEPIQIIFIVAGLIVFKIPTRLYHLGIATWQLYRIKTMFHYLEYRYRGNKYHTRRSGPLNDLEGTGLLMEVKSRGGKVDIHIEGTRDFVQAYINTREEEIADWRGQTYNN